MLYLVVDLTTILTYGSHIWLLSTWVFYKKKNLLSKDWAKDYAVTCIVFIVIWQTLFLLHLSTITSNQILSEWPKVVFLKLFCYVCHRICIIIIISHCFWNSKTSIFKHAPLVQIQPMTWWPPFRNCFMLISTS